jgi:hypothetical protein
VIGNDEARMSNDPPSLGYGAAGEGMIESRMPNCWLVPGASLELGAWDLEFLNRLRRAFKRKAADDKRIIHS